MASTIQTTSAVLERERCPLHYGLYNPAAFNRVLLDFLSHRLKE
jgi:hypothetical protein